MRESDTYSGSDAFAGSEVPAESLENYLGNNSKIDSVSEIRVRAFWGEGEIQCRPPGKTCSLFWAAVIMVPSSSPVCCRRP